ncbi:MAG: MFS transporter [Limisphaerales bacterium]
MNPRSANQSRFSVRALNSFRTLPASIWVLGFVSMFMDISSEMIHSLLPVYLVSVLGVSVTTVGVIEGIAEATAAITKVFSGAISDHFGSRKLLAVLGYGLAAITKPIFPLANSISWVVAARFIDRVGKGIRGAPRDALVADLAPRELRGAAFGLRQSLDSIGAFLGPLVAVVLMATLANDIRSVLWVAAVPALVAVVLLVLGIREPATVPSVAGAQRPRVWTGITRLPGSCWRVILLGATFTLARFSEAFLVLRAQDVGLGLGYVPLVLIVMNLVYTLAAYPAGVAADHHSPRVLLGLGLLMLVVADLILAAAASPLLVFIGTAVWGLHMGFTQGLFAKLVADTAPPELRGTAFGAFNLIGGVALLVASSLAGALWGRFGAVATFLSGAGFALLALLGLLVLRGPTHRE